MAFTYDLAALNVPANQVRLMTGDTNKNDPLLQDEELAFVIGTTGSSNIYAMAAAAARFIAAKLAKEVDAVNEPLRQMFSQRMSRFLKLAELWEENLSVDPAGAAASSPWSSPLGGASVRASAPAFYRGVASDPTNNPTAPGYGNGSSGPGLPYPNG